MISEVRQNIDEMRTENIKLKAQINTMTREKEDTEDKIKELEKDLENNKNKITN